MSRTKDPMAIVMYRGDSYPITLTIRDAITKALVDLTGATLKMTVDTLANPPDASTKLFDVAGVLTGTPTDGKATFTPTIENTGTVGDYYYDVQLTDAEGNIRTVAKSTFKITMDITK